MSGKLSAAAIRNGLPRGKHADGQGMYLEITDSGGMYWRMKYRIDKKEKKLAFGTYPEVSLAEARVKRDDARQQLRAGIDPNALKKETKAARIISEQGTVEKVAQSWLEHKAAGWRVSKILCVRHTTPPFRSMYATQEEDAGGHAGH